MLIAKFEFRLSSPLHVATNNILHIKEVESIDENITENDVFKSAGEMIYQLNIDGFDVSVELHQDIVKNPLAHKHQWYGCQQVTLTVTNLSFAPSDLEEYRTSETFSKVAYAVINRLIDFCRYELGYPFLRPANASNLESVDWFDATSTLLRSDKDKLIVDFFPGVPGNSRSLGSQFLTPHHTGRLTTALTDGVRQTVQQELLAFARDAIYEGHILKAILLLAVSSEVTIKTTFFREETLASVAFDYLEENRRVEVTPIELINKVAKRAFGNSFSEYDAAAAVSIDHLFRCRNKVAHRAIAVYKDDKGALHSADEATLYKWWEAATTLQNWLEAQRSKSA